MFLRNCWYVAARADEVGRRPLARTLLGEPVVLFRAGDGAPAALEDRCCHRHLPLSEGEVVGDRLRCGYHGLLFDRAGRCVEIPGQTAIPPGARIKRYPLVERWGWLWIWMGDPADADESAIEDFHWLDDPGWRAKGAHLHVACNYLLVVDNLLDLNHLPYVHESTLGNAAVAERAEVKTERRGAGVRVTRWMIDVPPPPMYVDVRGFVGNIDRWQIIDFSPPCFVKLDLGAAPAGAGAVRDGRAGAMTRMSLNAITPETDSSVHYFWADAHGFALDRPEVTESLFRQVRTAFDEDKAILEAQQRAFDRWGSAPRVDVNGDAGGIEARRIVDRLVAAEAAGRRGEARRPA